MNVLHDDIVPVGSYEKQWDHSYIHSIHMLHHSYCILSGPHWHILHLSPSKSDSDDEIGVLKALYPTVNSRVLKCFLGWVLSSSASKPILSTSSGSNSKQYPRDWSKLVEKVRLKSFKGQLEVKIDRYLWYSWRFSTFSGSQETPVDNTRIDKLVLFDCKIHPNYAEIIKLTVAWILAFF